MSYTDYRAEADKCRRDSQRAYREARKDAEFAESQYRAGRNLRRHAAWLARHPDLSSADYGSPASWEESARITEQLADTMLQCSFSATARARDYAAMARGYDRMAAERDARLAAYAAPVSA